MKTKCGCCWVGTQCFTELCLCFCVGYDIAPRVLWGGLGCDMGFCKARGVITNRREKQHYVPLVIILHKCDAHCWDFLAMCG